MAENAIDAHDLETIERILAATASTSGSGVLPLSVLRCLADLFPGAVAGVVSELDTRSGDHVGRRLAPRTRPVDAAPDDQADGAYADSLRVTFPARDRGRPVHVCVTRSEPPFSTRDRVLFDLLAPRLEDLLVDARRQHDRQSLSPRELRVLRLVAEGASNAEVSAQLSVSVATVRKHLEHIYLKLGVRNRTAAARVLGDGGSPPPMHPSV
jgi:DNA-binding CsgD family transcriptional regulator